MGPARANTNGPASSRLFLGDFRLSAWQRLRSNQTHPGWVSKGVSPFGRRSHGIARQACASALPVKSRRDEQPTPKTPRIPSPVGGSGGLRPPAAGGTPPSHFRLSSRGIKSRRVVSSSVWRLRQAARAWLRAAMSAKNGSNRLANSRKIRSRRADRRSLSS